MIILSLIALILIVTGAGFFISSLYLYLAAALQNSAMAAFFSGLAIILLAILLLLIVILIKSSLFKFKTFKNAKIEIGNNNLSSEEAVNLVKEYPYSSALVALGSGFLLGFCPTLRNSLIDGVSTYMRTGSVADSLKSMKIEENENV